MGFAPTIDHPKAAKYQPAYTTTAGACGYDLIIEFLPVVQIIRLG
jgi:hypothetical protein